MDAISFRVLAVDAGRTEHDRSCRLAWLRTTMDAGVVSYVLARQSVLRLRVTMGV
jgi:hypothetical protein